MTPLTCDVPPLSDSQASQSKERSLHLLLATVSQAYAVTEQKEFSLSAIWLLAAFEPQLVYERVLSDANPEKNNCSSSGITLVLFLFNGQLSKTFKSDG